MVLLEPFALINGEFLQGQALDKLHLSRYCMKWMMSLEKERTRVGGASKAV